jgi:adenylate kinase family enzyme
MAFSYRHIHIVGASGAGTTTLGAALAAALGAGHLDTDAFYWLPTSPPFRDKRPVAERLDLLRAAFGDHERWILSGSLLYWGVELATEFDLVVFLHTPAEVRLERTLARERQRYGRRILPGGDMRETHLAFLAWTRAYDTARTPGRNLFSHKAWLATLTCPVLEIAGAQPVEESLGRVLAFGDV